MCMSVSAYSPAALYFKSKSFLEAAAEGMKNLAAKIIQWIKVFFSPISFLWKSKAITQPIAAEKVKDLSIEQQRFVNNLKAAAIAHSNKQGEILFGELRKIIVDNQVFYTIDKQDIQELIKNSWSSALQSSLANDMEISGVNSFFQVFGDSTSRPKDHSLNINGYLTGHVHVRTDVDFANVVLWGLTANPGDVNEAVNTFIDSTEKNPQIQPLACAVDVGTVKAIQEWGCQIPKKIVPVLLVCGGANFGDDVALSDFITDTGLGFEGGVISFQQGNHIAADSNTVIYHKSANSKGAFSAAGLMNQLKACQDQADDDLLPELVKAKNQYLTENPLKEKDVPAFNREWENFIGDLTRAKRILHFTTVRIHE